MDVETKEMNFSGMRTTGGEPVLRGEKKLEIYKNRSKKAAPRRTLFPQVTPLDVGAKKKTKKTGSNRGPGN